MNYAILIAIIGLVGVVAPVKTMPKELEVVSTFYTKELINGVEFMYREEVINGDAKKSWTVDGKEVKPARYLEAVLDAEKEVRRIERVIEEQNRMYERNAKLQAMIESNKKLLQIKLASVEQWLVKLNDNKLLGYLVFSPQTYDAQYAFDGIVEAVAQTKELLLAPSDDATLKNCERLAAQIDDAPRRMRDLFYATMDNAIKLCGDTKVLKELLEICQA